MAKKYLVLPVYPDKFCETPEALQLPSLLSKIH